MIVTTNPRELDMVTAFFTLYQEGKITAEVMARGILRNIDLPDETADQHLERVVGTSDLVEPLRTAVPEDVVQALTAVEVQGRPGFAYEVGLALWHANPVVVIPGPDPLSIHDRPDHGWLTITAYDPARRADAIKGIRALRGGTTTMEALALLKTLEKAPIEYEHYRREYAEGAKAEWESYGFTATVTGFGESRKATSHSYCLRDLAKPCVA